MKKEIMKRAHEIARTMKGDYIARMSMALRMAWAEARKPASVRLALNYGYGHSYIAKINGTHPKWKLDREFLSADEKKRSYSGKTGHNVYYISENGVYEKAVGNDREYFTISNGKVEYIDYGTVLSLVG